MIKNKQKWDSKFKSKLTKQNKNIESQKKQEDHPNTKTIRKSRQEQNNLFKKYTFQKSETLAKKSYNKNLKIKNLYETNRLKKQFTQKKTYKKYKNRNKKVFIPSKNHKLKRSRSYEFSLKDFKPYDLS